MEHDSSKNKQEGSPQLEGEWLEARFVALERKNAQLARWTRLLGASTMAALLAVGAMVVSTLGGVDDPAIVTAESFVLVDSEGQQRGEFSLGQDGASQLLLQDRTASDRLRMTVRSEGSPGIAFADASGNRRIVLGLLPDETSTLVFADAGGSIRAVLGMSQDNRANLVFADRRGVTRAGLGVDERGRASLMLPDTESEEDGSVAASEPIPSGPEDSDR